MVSATNNCDMHENSPTTDASTTTTTPSTTSCLIISLLLSVTNAKPWTLQKCSIVIEISRTKVVVLLRKEIVVKANVAQHGSKIEAFSPFQKRAMKTMIYAKAWHKNRTWQIYIKGFSSTLIQAIAVMLRFLALAETSWKCKRSYH